MKPFVALFTTLLLAACNDALLPDPGCAQHPDSCACADDNQCPAQAPRCDKNRGRCVACLPLGNDCPAGTRCIESGNTFRCSMACRTDNDCTLVDAGALPQCCNGACVDVASDPQYCGSCGTACPAPGHAKAGCVAGTCSVGACDDGYADCDKAVPNGCETNLQEDPKNCGQCGQRCPAGGHQEPRCVTGGCASECAPGFLHCSMNPADGCEVNGTTDSANCGGCGISCAALANAMGTCTSGACMVLSCAALFGDCNKMPGDGCETNVGADLTNCGACGRLCAMVANGAPTCNSGLCRVAMCAQGFADCDSVFMTGCETDITSDQGNCGSCGHACAGANSMQSCQANSCVVLGCSAGFADCDGKPDTGCEAGIRADVRNCGGCGRVCPIPANAVAGCLNGLCGIASCNGGFSDCNRDPSDGCETDATTIQNCGACGNVCMVPANASAGCKAGVCGIASCTLGFADCDMNAGNGCEKNLATDVASCGACGKVCTVANGQPSCKAGVCGIASCNAGFAECDMNGANGCETDINANPNHCGQCGNVCPMNTPLCQAGQCSVVRPSVLLVGAEMLLANLNDVQTNVQATGAFNMVDTFNAYSGTPALIKLQNYTAVLVWSNFPFKDPVTLGNVLADYYDGGGRVVIATFANADATVEGRFGLRANGYVLMDPGYNTAPDSLGMIVEPQSPLVAGVSAFSAMYAPRSTGQLVNGAVAVAKWAGGVPLIVRGVVKGRNRADLNFWPVSSAASKMSWTGDGAIMIKNALLYQ